MTAKPLAGAPEHLKRINAALALRDIPDYPAALAQLQKAVALSPTNGSAQLVLGLTYQDLGDLKAAAAHLRRAVNLDQDSAEARQSLAALLVQQGQNNEAIKLLTPIVQGTVHNVPVAQLMASALRNVDKATTAIEVLRSVYEDGLADSGLASQLGHLLLETDQPEEAAPILERAVELLPTPELLCELAAAYSLLNHFTDAVPLLEQALKQRPDYDRAWRGLAYCYLKLEDLDRALECAERALAINDKHFRNWQIKAEVLLKLDRRDEASEIIDRGIELSRQTPGAEAVLENLLVTRSLEILRRDGIDAAIAQIERDVHEFPEQIGPLHLKADLLLLNNDYEKALAALNDLVDHDFPAEFVALDYYTIYHGLQQPDEALAAVQQILDDPEERSKLLDDIENIGVRLYERGQIEATRNVFQQVLKLQPDHSHSMNSLAFVLIGEGQWAEAESLIHHSLELGFDQPAVALANLGYLALRQGRYSEAVELLRRADQQSSPDDIGILRVAYWYNSAFSDAPHERHPIRDISIPAAVRANMATAYYLSGDVANALAMAQSAIDVAPQDNTGHKVMGCLQLALGNIEAARAAWEQALTLHKTKAGGALIQEWLRKLPSQS